MQKSRSSRAALAVVLASGAFLIACGRDDGVRPPEDVMITNQGGTVTSANGRVTLVVPPGALTQTTGITIRPAPASGDQRLVPGTEYIFEPDGLQFAVPARLTIRYDSVPAAMAEQAPYVWLHRRAGSGWTAMAGEPLNSTTRTLTGQITGFSSFAGVVSQLGANLLLAGLQLNALLNDALGSGAVALLQTIAAILQEQESAEFVALAQPFLDATITTACNAYANAVNTARSAPVDDWGVFVSLLKPVYGWAAIAIIAGADGGCPSAALTVEQIEKLKIDQFVDFYVRKLDPASIPQGFDGVVAEVKQVFEFRATVQLLGLDDADDRLFEKAQLPLMDELRLRAYQECRSRGRHEYLGRLRGAVEYSNYTDDDVLTDLQLCATQLAWRVTANNQSVDENGTLGGGATPGTRVAEDSTTAVAKGTITLSGDMRAFRCADGSFEADRLIVTLAGTEVHRRTATGGSFFSSPLQLDAETILIAARIDPARTATHALVVSRESLGCLQYISSNAPVTVATLRLKYPPPFLYTNDFQTTAGAEWSPQTITQSPSGEKFLGTFAAAEVTLTLANVPAHDTATIEFDFFTIRDWEGNAPPATGGPDIMTFLVDGQTVLRTSFSTKAGAGFEQSYPGTYPGANNPALTGASATGSLGYPNGSSHTGDARYRLSFTVPHNAATIRLTLRNESTAGSPNLPGRELLGLDNVRVTVR